MNIELKLVSATNVPSPTAASVTNVVAGGYCIGCGACVVADSSIRMVARDGMSVAEPNGPPVSAANEVCPFSSAIDEDEIAKSLYAELDHDPRIGRFREALIGRVSDRTDLLNSSSGGIVTWVLEQLLRRGAIDGVIHVGSSDGAMFDFRISRTVEEVRDNKKSRYYPASIEAALSEIKGDGKRYAFVGVPCFVKAVRLLQRRFPEFESGIVFCIAIFCGHMKSKAFAEMIGWQLGVTPRDLKLVDFRVKRPGISSNKYAVQVTPSEGAAKVASVDKLYGLDWGLGYFKPRACDWCDDIAGETADLACGDAWLPGYTADGEGNSVVVVRSQQAGALLKAGVDEGALRLDPASIDDIYVSQAGNFRHRREGLALRRETAREERRWVPVKRNFGLGSGIDPRRARIYKLRERLAERSHVAFARAKRRGSFLSFVLEMAGLELMYYWTNRRLLRGGVKSLRALGIMVTRRS